jgi:hypothetical protein
MLPGWAVNFFCFIPPLKGLGHITLCQAGKQIVLFPPFERVRSQWHEASLSLLRHLRHLFRFPARRGHTSRAGRALEQARLGRHDFRAIFSLCHFCSSVVVDLSAPRGLALCGTGVREWFIQRQHSVHPCSFLVTAFRRS